MHNRISRNIGKRKKPEHRKSYMQQMMDVPRSLQHFQLYKITFKKINHCEDLLSLKKLNFRRTIRNNDEKKNTAGLQCEMGLTNRQIF